MFDKIICVRMFPSYTVGFAVKLIPSVCNTTYKGTAVAMLLCPRFRHYQVTRSRRREH